MDSDKERCRGLHGGCRLVCVATAACQSRTLVSTCVDERRLGVVSVFSRTELWMKGICASRCVKSRRCSTACDSTAAIWSQVILIALSGTVVPRVPFVRAAQHAHVLACWLHPGFVISHGNSESISLSLSLHISCETKFHFSERV